ncbi:MAG TPA: YCF48-related protein [Pyrinomonadaceae bacterium]|nr:YCF48-related protein [Pyrinomonadaceae bacterium]
MPLFSIITLLLLTSFQWTVHNSGTTARLRGISAVSPQVVWVSGSQSTVLRSIDGGATWEWLRVTDEQLDFRDIDAVDANRAYVLSIGKGSASRIYKTTDGGVTWQLQFKAKDEDVFLDAMSFWDAEHGLAFGDSVNGQFYILRTDDGGKVWSRVQTNHLPKPLPNEGAFAASGTNIATFGKTHAWIGTGAAEKARVLRTSDAGLTWSVNETPLRAGPSAGIFSIAFRDALRGVVVGGDYQKENEALDNLAVTDDGGTTWKLVKGLSGYRSAVAYVPQSAMMVSVGPRGADYSENGGLTWKPLENSPGLDTLGFAPNVGASLKKQLRSRQASPPRVIAWASGAEGRIARLSIR